MGEHTHINKNITNKITIPISLLIDSPIPINDNTLRNTNGILLSKDGFE